jgi:hypothetical protein
MNEMPLETTDLVEGPSEGRRIKRMWIDITGGLMGQQMNRDV